MMAIVLSGLIFVQIRLIKQASDIREEQFDQLVRSALDLVATQLEGREIDEAREYAATGQIPWEDSTLDDFNIYPRSRPANNDLQIDIGNNPNLTGFRFESQSSSVSTNYGTQTQTTSQLSLQFQGLSNDELMRNRENYINNFDWMNYKSIYLETRPIQERIDSAFLNQIIATAMAEKGIDLDYKYAIMNSNNGKENQIVFGDKDYNKGKNTEWRQPLFQRDIERKANWLHIYFPKHGGYLLRTTGLTIIPTIILTAFLIGIFAYTIMIIFRQKKLSIIKNDFINNMTHEL